MTYPLFNGQRAQEFLSRYTLEGNWCIGSGTEQRAPGREIILMDSDRESDGQDDHYLNIDDDQRGFEDCDQEMRGWRHGEAKGKSS